MSGLDLASFDWQGLLGQTTDFAVEIAKKQSKEVVSSISDRLLETIRTKWEKVDWKGTRNDYRKNLLENLSTTKILGNPKTIRIEDVYTDAFVFDRISALKRFAGDINSLQTADSLQEGTRLPALEVAETGDNLFILGRPGAGKTTFLKYLAILACKGRIKKTPIFISLKDWSDSSLSLIPYIANQFDLCGFPDAEIFVRALLERGDAIILLDGLDEVNEQDSKRKQTIKEVVNLSLKYKKCQYCLTCRTAATDYSFEKFKYLEVADFDANQQIQLVTQWYGENSEHLKRFIAGWKENEQEGLRDLGRTPLLLTLLCLAFEESLVFPARQVDLYKEAIDALLRKWDTSRLISRDDFYKNLSFSRREHLFEAVAAKFYFDSRTVFRRSELERTILDFLRDLPDKEKSEEADASIVIKQIEAQHGLIVERAVDIFSFSHLTIQEYFTASFLVKSHDEVILNNVVEVAMQDQKWREVMLYTVGLLPSADSVLEKMSKQLKNLRGSDPGVIRFLGYCHCDALLRRRKNGTPAMVGTTSAAMVKRRIEEYVGKTTNPPLTSAETEAIAEHFVKIRNFLHTREDKYDFGMAADIVTSAAELITKQPSRAAAILGGYFTRPDQFISYLYACRLMIECLEVAVVKQRKIYIESIMSINDNEITGALILRRA
ncbi:NACHT domain-containing protein [Herminiimonas aquatilis]|uniref:NACHT domain-containing protein n=1 Tax=Herminiimonas aquatilis TaxID=345342 RepID=A0ABW2J6E0_9BURK